MVDGSGGGDRGRLGGILVASFVVVFFFLGLFFSSLRGFVISRLGVLEFEEVMFYFIGRVGIGCEVCELSQKDFLLLSSSSSSSSCRKYNVYVWKKESGW